MTGTTISASKARSNFYTLLNDVSDKLKRYVVTHRGNAKVVLMHPDEVASWEETMDIISDSNLITDITKSDKELASGKTTSESKFLKELGIDKSELT